MKNTKSASKPTTKAANAAKLSLKDAIALVEQGPYANGLKAAIKVVLNVAYVRQARYEARAAVRAKKAKKSSK